MKVLSLVDGVAPPENNVKPLCASVDTNARTWVGAATQKVFKVSTKGDHAARVEAHDEVTGWAVDDSSLVVDTPILANRPAPLTAEHLARILKAEDVAAAVLFVATLPPHVTVPELIIKPTDALYV